jgi:hypothetical protein
MRTEYVRARVPGYMNTSTNTPILRQAQGPRSTQTHTDLVHGLTVPLLTTASGVKFGKSAGKPDSLRCLLLAWPFLHVAGWIRLLTHFRSLLLTLAHSLTLALSRSHTNSFSFCLSVQYEC